MIDFQLYTEKLGNHTLYIVSEKKKIGTKSTLLIKKNGALLVAASASASAMS
jgi:hypothetical protein